MKKRILTFFISMCLIVSALPTNIFATHDYYKEFDNVLVNGATNLNNSIMNEDNWHDFCYILDRWYGYDCDFNNYSQLAYEFVMQQICFSKGSNYIENDPKGLLYHAFWFDGEIVDSILKNNFNFEDDLIAKLHSEIYTNQYDNVVGYYFDGNYYFNGPEGTIQGELYSIDIIEKKDNAYKIKFINNDMSSYGFEEDYTYTRDTYYCIFEMGNDSQGQSFKIYGISNYDDIKWPTKEIKVVLNGREIEFDQPPVMVNDRVMVPMRKIFEELGYSVEWYGDTQTAVAKKGSNTITVGIGKNNISYGKGTYNCDVAPMIISRRTLVPVRAISECDGCNVEWDSENYSVIITSRKTNEDDIVDTINIDINISDSLSIVEGKKDVIHASLRKNGTDISDKLKITSSNESVIKIVEFTEDLLGGILVDVEAINVGLATITAQYGNSKATCKVNVSRNTQLDGGLKMSVTYKGEANNTGLFTVKLSNDSKETIVVDLDGGEGSVIEAKTAKNILVSFDYRSRLESINGNNTVTISELKPGETYEFTHQVRTVSVPGDFFVTIKAEAEGFETISLNKKITILDSAINTTQIDMATNAKNLVDRLKQNIKNKSNSNDIIAKRNNVKKYIKAIGANVPDEIYDAFAMAILSTLSESDIEKFEKDPIELTNQIYGKTLSGFKNDNKTVIINGCEYEVQYTIWAMAGVGVAEQTVSWKNELGAPVVSRLLWQNAHEKEGKMAVAEFCAALAELNKDVWKEFSAYYFSDLLNLSGFKEITKDNVMDVFDMTEKVIYALCDKSKADDLIDEIGGKLKEELSSLLDNEFKKYVKKNVPNGEEIVDAAEKYEKAKKKYDKWAELWNKDSNSGKTQKAYEDFQTAYELLEMAINEI